MNFYQSSNPKLALEMGFNLLSKSESTLDFDISEVHALIGVILKEQGFPVRAMEHLVKSVEFHIEKEDTLQLGWYFIEMGNIYYQRHYFKEAERKFKRAVNIFELTENIVGQGTGINNLALVEIKRENYNQAFVYFEDALQRRINYKKEPYLILHSYKYIGDLHLKLGHYKNAKETFDKLLTVGIPEGEGNIKGLTHQSLMEMYIKTGKSKKAMVHFAAAESNYLSDFNPKYLATLYLTIATYYERSKQLKSAMTYLDKIIPISEKYGFIQINITTLEKIILLHEMNVQSPELVSLFHQLNDLREKQYNSDLTTSLDHIELGSVNLIGSPRRPNELLYR
ncbi:MAG: tetratricopeptide repeat protein, partial [Candidatus Marinimicrobia bacterium]|nr:tetratricopeptide repeat protein [Candidatus Neomarinimicrobiota bacterium]